METIRVKASTEYDVLVGRGLLPRLGDLAREVNRGTKALLVTDETVGALYGAAATASLTCAGFETSRLFLPPGEGSKTPEGWLSVLRHLAGGGFTRGDLLIALGGGVVSDLTGFAAAAYQRGMDYISVPTTLLAMVDASVGGKTGLNLPEGKNLVGAFYQPKRVICDPDFLQTLPQNVLSDGFAEVIKYGMIGDGDLLTMLQAPFAPQAESVILRCIIQKRDLVQEDERDRGIRRLLNFGHTVGHAIEACSAFRISHGKAVAIGMAAMTKIAEHTGDCGENVYWELADLLSRYGLPTALPYSPEALWQAAFADKKRQGDTLFLVLPIRRGQCRIRPCSMEDYRKLLEVCETL